MSNLITAQHLSKGLLEALNLPENTYEFTLTAKVNELVTLVGKHYVTDTEIAEFERTFKDKAELT